MRKLVRRLGPETVAELSWVVIGKAQRETGRALVGQARAAARGAQAKRRPRVSAAGGDRTR